MARTKRHATYYFTPKMLDDIGHYAKLANRSKTNFVETAIMVYIEYIKENSVGSAGEQPTGDDDRP